MRLSNTLHIFPSSFKIPTTSPLLTLTSFSSSAAYGQLTSHGTIIMQIPWMNDYLPVVRRTKHLAGMSPILPLNLTCSKVGRVKHSMNNLMDQLVRTLQNLFSAGLIISTSSPLHTVSSARFLASKFHRTAGRCQGKPMGRHR